MFPVTLRERLIGRMNGNLGGRKREDQPATARVHTVEPEHVMEEAARAGASAATLEVRASNTAARHLYATLGFVETAVRPHYYTKPEEDGIILWREGLPRG